jgi:[protein-PII] uridylyltransferase
MPVAEAEIRPKKATFHLKTAETILEEVAAAIGQDSPKSAQGRSAVLAVMRKSLAEARKCAKASPRRANRRKPS